MKFDLFDVIFPSSSDNPNYLIGGTALGGMEPHPEISAPYLTEPRPSNLKYTLVLDLDETLVHYFEDEGEGRY